MRAIQPPGQRATGCPDRAAIADRKVRYMARRLADDGIAGCYYISDFYVAMARQRADAQSAVRAIGNAAEFGNSINVDENGRFDEPEVRGPGVVGERHRRELLGRDLGVEAVGAELREMMPWIKAGKLVDKEQN